MTVLEAYEIEAKEMTSEQLTGTIHQLTNGRKISGDTFEHQRAKQKVRWRIQACKEELQKRALKAALSVTSG